MGNQRAKGNRYSEDSKLNYSKVLAVIIAIIVVVVFVMAINQLLGMDIMPKNGNEYFALYEQEKWGVIDNKGNTVIVPSYAEMIIIPNKEKDIFICTYEINNETGEYKSKVLNKKNKEIFTEYEQVEVLENYDKGQNIWYEDDVLKVKQNGKYGLINYKGNQILECEYDKIDTLKGIEDSIIIEKDGKLGLVDNTGRKIINTEYKEIMALGTKNDEGYITVNEEGKYGVISYTKEQELPNKYEYIEPIYGKEFYVIKERGQQKLINSKEEPILDSGYSKIEAILTHSVEGIIFEREEKYGIMSTDKTILIRPQYDSIKELENGMFVAEKDGKKGIIDIKNEEKLPFSYNTVSYNQKADLYIAEDTENKTSIIDRDFNIKLIGTLSEFNEENEYIRMRIEDKYEYYNFRCEEKENTEVLKGNTLFLKQENGKYGYVNKKEEMVVDYQYDDATEQNRYGYVAVKKNGLWGALDRDGKEVIAPKYELTNNIIIDFIGKWHLGEDLNMKYYCEK
ncbi:MAG: WG repeat-containing protein [Clostridia bacterium]|nr:WG repeat-containing protein [Clostridia bacterium]